MARGHLLHGVGCWGLVAKRPRIAGQLRSLQARLYRRARRLNSRAPTSFACRIGHEGIAWDELCLFQCAKQRLTFPEFLDAEPVKDIVGGAVHPYPVERFVEAAGCTSYTVDHTANPDCLSDSGTAEICADGSVLPGQWAGCGIAFATITGEWVTSARKLPNHSTPLQAEILGIWLAASIGSSQPHAKKSSFSRTA